MLRTRILIQIIAISAVISSCLSCSSWRKGNSEILFEEHFNKDLRSWVIEQMAGGHTEIIDGKMHISQENGAVVWFKHKLIAPVNIEYDITVIDRGGVHDRIADMNCFWMANDPQNPGDFFRSSAKRAGVFSAYFSHSLYYVGQGGHDNTKTRFRKYIGNGERPLKPQHDLSNPAYLISANKRNSIKIVVTSERTQYYCNEQLIYDIAEDDIYTSGYFGIRSYKNHLSIDNLVISSPIPHN